MRINPRGVRFSELRRVCEAYFGQSRQSGTSHLVFKTPWAGDPRINIQNSKGKTKVYQVQQVLRALDRIEAEKS